MYYDGGGLEKIDGVKFKEFLRYLFSTLLCEKVIIMYGGHFTRVLSKCFHKKIPV